MSSPIMTEEDLNEEKKSLEDIVKNSVKSKDSLNKEIIEKSEKEITEDIPSCYIEINLVSNGRIKGVPDKLHFKCYSATDALDLNVDDDDKPKAISKVLSRLCYENFDVSLLTVQDVLYILYKLHGTFISKKITKKVYIDDSIEDDELLNADSNLEEVDIPINSLVYAYLGKDYDDNDLEDKIKVPFKIQDSATKDSIGFRFPILKDFIMGQSYCKNFYKDEFIKYNEVRSVINKINSIKNEDEKDATLDKYLNEHEDKAKEYYDFMIEYSKMLAKVVQAQCIVSYNENELNSFEEKWKVWNENVTVQIWSLYEKTVGKFPFGIKDDIDVFLPSLKKVVHRRVGFQFNDFLHIDRQEESDRYTVKFD